VVIATPVDDAFLDGFGFEILGEGLMGKGGEFVVGGEAKGDELFNGELVDVGAIFGREQCVEAEAFLAADDAILYFESAIPSDACHNDEDEGHDDPPQEKNSVFRPVVNGGVDGEDEVEQQHGQDEEMKGWIVARVVLKVLRGGHGNPLRANCAVGPQHTICGRLERWQRRGRSGLEFM
jgi:hypothetical protein